MKKLKFHSFLPGTNYFAGTFTQDIDIILGECQGERANQNNSWLHQPRLLIISLLCYGHWRAIRVVINYAQKAIDVLWDDPFGLDCFSKQIKKMILTTLKTQIERLINKECHVKDFQLTPAKIIEREKPHDQQGRGQNSSDCGPIIYSNINDYLNENISNQRFTLSGNDYKYSLSVAKSQNHWEQIVGQRKEDRAIYKEIIKTKSQSQIPECIQSQAAAYNSKIIQFRKHISNHIESLNDRDLTLLFSIVHNNRLLSPEYRGKLDTDYNDDEITTALKYLNKLGSEQTSKNRFRFHTQPTQNQQSPPITTEPHNNTVSSSTS